MARTLLSAASRLISTLFVAACNPNFGAVCEAAAVSQTFPEFSDDPGKSVEMSLDAADRSVRAT